MNYNNIHQSLAVKELELLQKARQKAVLQLDEQLWPSKKSEKYKYTSIGKDLAPDDNLAKRLRSSSIQEISSYILERRALEIMIESLLPNLDAHYVFLSNGRMLSETYNDGSIAIQSLAQLSSTLHPFNALAGAEYDAPTAFNTAFWQDGIVLQVGFNQRIEKPIVIVNWVDKKDNEVICVRNLMEFYKGSKATVLFYNVGTEGVYISNQVNEVFLSEGAQVDLIRLQNESTQSTHINNDYVEQSGKSLFNCTTIAIGSAVLRNTSQVSIKGEEAENHLYGLVVGGEKQHIDNYTFVDHAVPNCLSNELYKSVVNQQAVSVFNGRILVRPDAQKTLAFQSNRNIILSDTAKVYTKPQLEIYADDVKCSHGATIGQPDDEALFYLQSRGIDLDKAKLLLMSGFVNEVLAKVDNEILSDFLLEKVEAKLQQSVMHKDQ